MLVLFAVSLALSLLSMSLSTWPRVIGWALDDYGRRADLALLARAFAGVAFVFACAAMVAGCNLGNGPGTSRPGLGAVLSRVDVPRLLACSSNLPDYKAVAKCLGAEALTQGLRAAIDYAVPLAERAQEAAGPAGADDMTDAQRDELGGELDRALGALAVEIHATHEPG